MAAKSKVPVSTEETEVPFRWERQPRETTNAYQAFCVYRDMLKSRSVIKAYRLRTGRNQVVNLPGQWQLWQSENEWRIRADAYDLYLEAQARNDREAAYYLELDKYKEQIKDLSGATLSGAVAMLKLVLEKVKKLNTEDISPALVPAYARAAAAIAEAATNAKAVALGLEEVMKQIAEEG